ncbi:MAG: NYN domain-containing protein [Chloroflexota bacterium]
MPYLIDGHNLIPKAGLSLESADDELELISALQEYSRKSRRGIEVYFDGAPAGQSGSRRFGQVLAHFISQRSTADAAISARLRQLGRAARNWTVVSSDRGVLGAAVSARARTETSEQFAGRLNGDHASVPGRLARQRPGGDGGLSEKETQDWLNMFKER